MFSRMSAKSWLRIMISERSNSVRFVMGCCGAIRGRNGRSLLVSVKLRFFWNFLILHNIVFIQISDRWLICFFCLYTLNIFKPVRIVVFYLCNELKLVISLFFLIWCMILTFYILALFRSEKNSVKKIWKKISFWVKILTLNVYFWVLIG